MVINAQVVVKGNLYVSKDLLAKKNTADAFFGRYHLSKVYGEHDPRLSLIGLSKPEQSLPSSRVSGQSARA